MLIYFLLFTIVSCCLLVIHVKRKGISCGFVFHALFILFNIGFPFLALLLLAMKVPVPQNQMFLRIIEQATLSDHMWAAFLIMVAYVVFLLVFRGEIFVHSRRKTTDSIPVKICEGNENYLTHRMRSMQALFTVIGGGALFLLAIDVGGLRMLLSIAWAIRGYSIDSTQYISGFGAFCKVLTPFIIGAFVCGLCLMKSGYKNYALFAVDSVLMVFCLLFENGRGPIILAICCVIYSFMRPNKKTEKRIIWFMLLVFVLLMFTSDVIEVVMQNLARNRNIFEDVVFDPLSNMWSTISYVAFSYSNLLNVDELVDFAGYRFGSDYILWLVDILPARLFSTFGINLPDIEPMSLSLSRYYVDFYGHNGQVPITAIVAGYFQLNVIGLIIHFYIMCKVTKMIGKIVDNLPRNYNAIKFWTWTYVIQLLTNGDPMTLIKNYLYMIVIYVVLNNMVKYMQGKKRLVRVKIGDRYLI